MKKTIVVADRDESLQHAFMTVFSKAHFEIIHASTGKEVERIAERMNPDVYIVNVDLPKTNGIEVYKKLQKMKLLDKASFFFLKDESDSTELLGYQADGVIEKPINFFRVYETVTREDDAVELSELMDEGLAVPREKAVEEETGLTDSTGGTQVGRDRSEDEDRRGDLAKPMDESAMEEEALALALSDEEVRSSIRHIGERLAAELGGPTDQETPSFASAVQGATEAESAAAPDRRPAEGPGTPTPEHPLPRPSVEEEIKEMAEKEARTKGEARLPGTFGLRLRDAMDSLSAANRMTLADTLADIEEADVGQAELEAQFKIVLNQAMEEAALKLSESLAPVLAQYVEDYVKRVLLMVAEKVVREEIEKLLKESVE